MLLSPRLTLLSARNSGRRGPSICCVHSRRSFFNQPAQTYTANRTLPYTQAALFKVIADIDAYKHFVPFCTDSHVTQHTNDSTPLPTQADLKVGFKQYQESFTSRVHCVPDTSVQAVASQHPLFKKLVAAWRLSRVGEDACKVQLEVEYQFVNPLYGAVSAAVVPKVAGQVLEAFERHVDTVLRDSREHEQRNRVKRV